MKNYHNIESKKSPFGNYRLGYGNDGIVYKIVGNYSATNAPNVPANAGKPIVCLTADTLQEMSEKLEKLHETQKSKKENSRL